MSHPLLEVRGLSIRFGGLVAVAEVDLTLNHSEVVCIIGPNGAGKSTLFNLISGIYRPTHGSMKLEGKDITGWPAHRIAAAGIARTFQSSRLFNDLTLLDNVLIGMHTRTRSGVFDALLRPATARAELEAAAARAGELLHAVSPQLHARRHTLAGALPQADRRRLEIVRALASEPRVIMLDEPSSGMDDRDTDGLMADVRRVMAERPGLSFLIIEHDMRLVAALPDRVAVIDYGRKIADGDFSQVRLMPRVQEAYLGQKAAHHA
ncbi:ABC transporter ATP-binding protein [Aquamicrobium sp. NLF2-7]|uniref:ABC transporter ATP-binding protein n=1 Tax=unclassified Aquamicrobium TaxID=2618194 RepID=UPI001EFAD461|nr:MULTISPECIES: ABC transporter ATP-binding protein [unclassified Aquamicrobium]MCG8271190.1 ABC transporter ATP-binding protein [Aquamicrobium sp. NLF2-7]MCK9549703.1 ABC transporter ATP-binding protein [Aquamicrobium sp.]